METNYPRLNFTPHWKVMNENLCELVDLVSEEQLDWTPAPTEWSIRVIATHINLARSHHLIGSDAAQIGQVIARCRTKNGLQEQLRLSWATVEALVSDQRALDALHEPPPGPEPEYLDPGVYDGHYVAYHRMAHDLHHRSTIIGHLAQLGVSLDGHRVRPL